MKSRSLLLIVLGLILITSVVRGTTCEYSLGLDDQWYLLAGNPGCTDVESCSSCTEYKLESNFAGPHTDGTITVTLTVQDYSGLEWLTFKWQSNIPVTAVIVKGGKVTVDGEDYFSYVYKYGSPRTSDNCLSAPSGTGISHITFCYTPPQFEVTAEWSATLEITQPMIADWAAHPTEFTQPFGNLTVSVTATINYALQIYYTVGLVSDFSPPLGAMPLAFEYGTGSGNWTSIPPDEGTTQSLPAPTGIGTNEHTYPMRVDLALLGAGDRTADDSITFEVHVMVTEPGI